MPYPFDSDPFRDPFLTPRRQPALKAMTPEETDTALSKLLGGAVGGLGWVGETLDKSLGGRAVRGLLGGRPDQLLSLIPFSDTLGITDPADAVRGEDLLKQWGVLEGEGTKGEFELRDLAGPALELLIDPGSYLSTPLSALTKAGVAAQKAGKLAPTLKEGIAAGERGLIGLGLPFMKPSVVLGTGKTAEAIAGGLGKVYDKALYSGPGRALSAMFDPEVEGRLASPIQRELREGAAAKRAADTAAEEFALNAAKRLQDAGEYNPQMHDVIRGALEGSVSPLPGSATADVVDEFRAALAARPASESALGLESKVRKNYAPRQLQELNQGTKGYRTTQALSPTNPSMIARDEDIADMLTSTLNAMARDQAISGTTGRGATNLLSQAKLIRENYLNFDNAMEAERHTLNALKQSGGTMTPAQVARMEELNGLYKQSEQLAERFAGLDPKRAEEGIGLFQEDIFKDVAGRLSRGSKSEIRAQAIHNSLAKSALPASSAPQNWVPMADVLNAAGLKNVAGATTSAEKALAGLNPKAAGVFLGGGTLHDFRVSPEMAKDLTRYVQGFTRPETLEPLLNVYDSITALFKAGVHSVFPKTRIRNLVGGLFQTFTKTDPGNFVKSTMDSFNVLRHGKEIVDAPAILGNPAMSAADATKELASEFAAREGFYLGKAGRGTEELGNVAARNKALAPNLPGEGGEGVLDIVKSGFELPKKREDWLGIAGVGGRKETTLAPVAASRKLDQMIDDTNRFAMYLAKRREGFDANAAYAEVLKSHYNFKDATGFEKSVMRRLVPFYCVPDHSKILTRDGWKTCDELIVSEEVLTYNVEDDRLEWQPCQDKAIFEHDEELLVFESERRRIEFTPDHRWPVRIQEQIVKRPYGTYVYPEKISVKTGLQLRSGHSFIVSANHTFDQESLINVEQARLLGWMMTDGYFRTRGNYVEAVVYQHPKKFIEEVKQVAGGTSRSPHPDTGTICVPVLKERTEEIADYLDKDNLVKVVTRLNREAADAMYDAMYKADGTVSEKRTSDHFAKEHTGIRDAFRILALLLGKQTTESHCNGRIRGCHISDRRYIKIDGRKIKREHYKGRVWCPRTANGTWVMKQNDFILITGNSWQRQNLPRVLEDLVERPGGPAASLIKAGEDLRDEERFVPRYIGEGPALAVGGEKDGYQRFVSKFGTVFEDALKNFVPGDLGRTIGSTLSEFAPQVKLPIELATGTQLMSGRDIDELHSLTGNPIVDQLLYNSPLSRVATTGRTLLDDRKDALTKAINLLSPATVTDVDIQAARSKEGRELVERLVDKLPESRTTERRLVPKDLIGQLSPEEQTLMRLYAGLENQRRKKK